MNEFGFWNRITMWRMSPSDPRDTSILKWKYETIPSKQNCQSLYDTKRTLPKMEANWESKVGTRSIVMLIETGNSNYKSENEETVHAEAAQKGHRLKSSWMHDKKLRALLKTVTM